MTRIFLVWVEVYPKFPNPYQSDTSKGKANKEGTADELSFDRRRRPTGGTSIQHRGGSIAPIGLYFHSHAPHLGLYPR